MIENVHSTQLRHDSNGDNIGFFLKFFIIVVNELAGRLEDEKQLWLKKIIDLVTDVDDVRFPLFQK